MIKVELKTGFVDEDGKCHRHVTVRAPRMIDEFEAEAEHAEWATSDNPIKKRLARGDRIVDTLLLARCIVDWGEIAKPDPVRHIATLTRGDYGALVGAMMEAETADEEAQSGKDHAETGAPS